MLVLEDLRLEQLQDPQDVDEEGQVILLPELLEIEVNTAMQQCCDHWQVPEKANRRKSSSSLFLETVILQVLEGNIPYPLPEFGI